MTPVPKRHTELPQPGEPQALVIIGNGMTSWRLCRDLVECGAIQQLRVVVIGAERHPAYDRVRLTKVLSGTKPEDLYLAGPEWYAEHGIELRLGDPVVAIDREDCVVTTRSGDIICFDRLVLATGSVPFVPELPGATLPGVFVYRTIDDLHAIHAHAAGRKRAVVVGGGPLGLEAARAVRDLGLEIVVIEGGPRLMQRALDDTGGRRLQQLVEEEGMTVLAGRRPTAIEPAGERLTLRLGGDACVEACMVVLAAGVRPATQLARDAGLLLAPNGGVMVDDTLQTSDDRIFAMGECAAHRGRTYGLVAPGNQMARVLVANLTGGRRRFRELTPSLKLKLAGAAVASIGDVDGDATTVAATWENGPSYRKIVLRRGRLVGAMAVGTWPGFDQVSKAVEGGALITPWQLRRFRAKGELWGVAAATSVDEWPDDAIVCTCTGVTRGQLVAACAAGAGTVEACGRATGAGSVCGGCKPLIEQLVQITPCKPRPAPTRALSSPSLTRSLSSMPSVNSGIKRRNTLPPFRAVRVTVPKLPGGRARTVLAVAGAAALVITLALVFGPALPAPRTALGDKILAALDARMVKLVTGFSAAGLAALSLLLSLRKRVRRFKVGALGFWRALHGAAGALAAVATVLHTGGRLGSHLNLALMLSFLAALATGATAGLLPRGKRMHVLILWPLPALVVLHILSVFFYA